VRRLTEALKNALKDPAHENFSKAKRLIVKNENGAESFFIDEGSPEPVFLSALLCILMSIYHPLDRSVFTKSSFSDLFKLQIWKAGFTGGLKK